MIREFDECLTVRELKRIVRNWDEVDEDGVLREVWLSNTKGLSYECCSLSTLDKGDLLLGISR